MNKYNKYLEKLTIFQIIVYEYEIFRPVLLFISNIKENPKLLKKDKKKKKIFEIHIQPFLSNENNNFRLSAITNSLSRLGSEINSKNITQNYLSSIINCEFYQIEKNEYKNAIKIYIKYLLLLNEEELKNEFDFYKGLTIFTKELLKFYCYQNKKLPILDLIKSRYKILTHVFECKNDTTNYWVVLDKKYLEDKLIELTCLETKLSI